MAETTRHRLGSTVGNLTVGLYEKFQAIFENTNYFNTRRIELIEA